MLDFIISTPTFNHHKRFLPTVDSVVVPRNSKLFEVATVLLYMHACMQMCVYKKTTVF